VPDQLKEKCDANVPKQAQQPVIDAFEKASHLQGQLLATGNSGRPSLTDDQSFSGSTKSFNRAIGNLSFIVVVAIL